jgi:hypothetical protein
LKAAEKALKSDATALLKTATTAGLSTGAVKRLADQMGLVPGKLNTKITADTATAMNDIGNLLSLVNRAAGTHYINMQVRAGGAVNAGLLHDFTSGNFAAGGMVGDGWFTVGEQGGSSSSWELGYKSGSRLRIYSNTQSKQITGTSHAPGYASGSGSPTPGRGSLVVRGGKLDISPDSQGRLHAWVREIVLEEKDFDHRMAGMR